jgi:rubredoxin
MKTAIIPPMPGMMAFYRCDSCGHLFRAAVPLFEFLGQFFKKCPHCGSRHVSLDSRIRY